MIEVTNLRHSYAGNRTIDFPELRIARGHHWLLLGESGSGKTTLLHLVGGLLRAQHGSIRVADTDIARLSEGELDRFRGKHMGFVFQRNHLLQALSVEDNLLMAPYLAGLPQKKERVHEVLSHLGLAEKRHAKMKELSQGQVQRVAIARAIMNKPEVILADEPTSALDDTNCGRVIDLLLQVAGETNATVVVATHDHRLKRHIHQQLAL